MIHKGEEVAGVFTYYDDKSVWITSVEFQAERQRYPLTDVDRIWQRRGARYWRAYAGRGMVVVAFVAPVVTAILGLVTALSIDASPTVTVALVGGSILVGLIVVPLADLLLGLLDDSYDRGAHQLELWAQVRQTPVLLVSSRDALRIGRIHRALRRAVEAALEAEALGSAPARSVAGRQPARQVTAGQPHRPPRPQAQRTPQRQAQRQPRRGA